MKDLFSDDSLRYKQARPAYSAEIVQEILKHVPERTFAWDCGAGSGQFTQLLAPYFEHVVATDISAAQLQQAPYFENVSYQLSATAGRADDYSGALRRFGDGGTSDSLV